MPEPVISVGNRYQILEQLGEGRKLVVYKALDTTLERHVVIMMILPYQVHSEQFLTRFKSEALLLLQLSEPNTPKILDYGEFENHPYLVMEYIPQNTTQSLANEPFFRRILQRLAGDSSTDAPPPEGKKKKGKRR